MNLTHEIKDPLKSYVYLYIDPRNGEIFYIGKGKGERYLFHLGDKSKTEKTKKIADIRLSGQEPQIDFLAYNLSDDEAVLIETAAINLIDKSKLTNKKAGNDKERLVRVNSEELISQSKQKKMSNISSMLSACRFGVYAINLDMLDNGCAYFSIFSYCFKKVENFREIRKPSLVKIKYFYDWLKKLGYFSEESFLQHDLVIGNKEEYQEWLKRKGWGFVTKQYLQEQMSEWLNPRECLTSSQGVFIDVELLPELNYLADFPDKLLCSDFMQTRCRV